MFICGCHCPTQTSTCITTVNGRPIHQDSNHPAASQQRFFAQMSTEQIGGDGNWIICLIEASKPTLNRHLLSERFSSTTFQRCEVRIGITQARRLVATKYPLFSMVFNVCVGRKCNAPDSSWPELLGVFHLKVLLLKMLPTNDRRRTYEI